MTELVGESGPTGDGWTMSAPGGVVAEAATLRPFRSSFRLPDDPVAVSFVLERAP